MCNRLHKDSKKIKREGKGYKLFATSSLFPNTLKPITSGLYWFPRRGWITWDRNKVFLPQIYTTDPYGFCFFTNKKIAKRVHRLWPYPTVLYKIEYKGGLGKHDEMGFIQDYTIPIALCKEFQILDET